MNENSTRVDFTIEELQMVCNGLKSIADSVKRACPAITNDTNFKLLESVVIKIQNGEKKMLGSELKGKYIIVRGINSGVFAGTLENIEGTVVKLSNVRRIWYWDGAASISELALSGPKKPDNCKFPPEVPLIIVLDAKEILEVSDVAQKAIKDVKPWKY